MAARSVSTRPRWCWVRNTAVISLSLPARSSLGKRWLGWAAGPRCWCHAATFADIIDWLANHPEDCTSIEALAAALGDEVVDELMKGLTPDNQTPIVL